MSDCNCPFEPTCPKARRAAQRQVAAQIAELVRLKDWESILVESIKIYHRLVALGIIVPSGTEARPLS